MLKPWTPLIAVHAIAASSALVVGGYNVFYRRRGDRRHRRIGRIWAGLMLFVAVTGLVIVSTYAWSELAFVDFFLSGLSVLTITTVSLGYWHARRHRSRQHAANMTGTYSGLIGAFIGVVVVPSRLVPSHFRVEPWRMTGYSVAIVTASLALISAVSLATHRSVTKRTAG